MTKNTKIRFDIKGRWSEEVNYNSLFKDTRSEKLKIFHMSGWENTINFISSFSEHLRMIVKFVWKNIYYKGEKNLKRIEISYH